MRVIDRRAWTVPPLFQWLQRPGSVPDDDMLRTFNMGIGLIVVCAPEDAAQVIDDLAGAGEPGAREIGTIEDGRTRCQLPVSAAVARATRRRRSAC